MLGGKTIGIVSIKGGVGKTTSVIALGSALANYCNKKVLIVDGNFSAPNLSFHIGMYNPEITIHHVLDDKAKIQDAIYETKFGFDILPGAIIYEKINPFKLSDKLRELRRKYDIILIDSSPNLNEEVLSTMIASDEILVVTTPDHVTLATTIRAIKLARDRRTPISGIILNKVFDKDFEISLENIESASGVQILAVLPHELDILESLSKSTPSTFNKDSKSSIEFKKLASALTGVEYKEGKAASFFRRFLTRVPKQEVNRIVLTKTRI